MRHVRTMKAVVMAVTAMIILVGCGTDGTTILVVNGILNPDDDPGVDMDALDQALRAMEEGYRRVYLGPVETGDHVGDNWSIRSILGLGEYQDTTGDESRTSDHYLALATDDSDEGTHVSVHHISREHGSGSFGTTPVMLRGICYHARCHRFGDDDSPVVAFTWGLSVGSPVSHRLQLVAGRVNNPNVAEFTITFSRGGSITLSAEDNAYFVGMIEREPWAHRLIDDITIRDIVAVDSKGATIP